MDTEITIADDIKSKIFTIRGLQVMIDRDLAELYGVETKALNQAVKRNSDRFPNEFMFRLNNQEKDELVTNCYRLQNLKHSSRNPFSFTEQGVAMLSGVLKTTTAVNISIMIIKSFVSMRKFLIENASIFQRLDRIELKQLESEQKFEILFDAIESKKLLPTQGVFFDGQIFDAYELASKIIRSATKSIILIDNYIDKTTLALLSKKEKGVKVLLLTNNKSVQLALDVTKANEQYDNFELKTFTKSHDRFLIIDFNSIYHICASLKDLGKKWFAFSKMDKSSVESFINSVSELI
jgi:phage regulator Rha-like protein